MQPVLPPVILTNDLQTWGRESLTQIRRDFYLPQSKLYAESTKTRHPAFNWGTGVLLPALVAGARFDSKFKPWLREYADASRVYWNDKGPIPGYDVLPGPKEVDRYYDDNAWMVMALCETSQVLNDKKYLRWAEQTLAYVLSGKDDRLGGGIYWREKPKNSKNTCSNGPSAAACLAVYDLTRESSLLAEAVSLYSWTKKQLQDPSDSLFWDNVSLSGKVERTKWSYNTGLMIRTAAHLFRITGLPSYRDDAVRMVAASRKRWLRDGRLQDEGKFAHLLLESWLFAAREIPECAAPSSEMREALGAIRSPGGFVPSHWGRNGTREDPMMIDQASFARACYMLGSECEP